MKKVRKCDGCKAYWVSTGRHNCDNFATPVEVWNAYKADCVENSIEPTIAGAISFLLSPEEKEGEAK